MCLTLWSLLQWLYEIIEAETCYLWLMHLVTADFWEPLDFTGKQTLL